MPENKHYKRRSTAGRQVRGFTLIELLVVIAIIGILANVMLGSLSSARDKGEDAAIRSNLNNVRAQSEIYYDDGGRTYTGVCLASVGDNPPGIADLIAGADTAGGGASGANCDDEDDAWAVEKELNSGEFYCVDSTGQAVTLVASKGVATTVCN